MLHPVVTRIPSVDQHTGQGITDVVLCGTGRVCSWFPVGLVLCGLVRSAGSAVARDHPTAGPQLQACEFRLKTDQATYVGTTVCARAARHTRGVIAVDLAEVASVQAVSGPPETQDLSSL